jgi:putative tail protein
MIEEIKEKCEALAIRKREELKKSLERGEVADPIFTPAFFISLAVSASISAASYLVSRALTPKPPRGQQGKLTGSLQLQNSEQGIFIPEIYGGSPTTSLVTGANPTYQNLANVTVGANGAITKTSGGSDWNAGASHNVSISAGQDAFFQFTVGTGYATAGFTLDSSPTSGNTDFLFAIQWNPDGSITIKYNGTQLLGTVTTWVTGDVFRLELRSGRFRLYKGSAEIVPPNFIFPSPSYPLFMGIAMQFVGAGISAAKVQIGSIGPAPNSGRGGIKIPAIIVWSSGIRKLVSTTQVPTGGGKGGGQRTQTVDNITYDIDLGMMFTAHGPHHLIREYANADILIDQFDQSANPSGVYDPTVGADPDYDPTLPPDPTLNHPLSFSRVDGDIPLDADNVGTGTIQGGGSGFAIYPGNNTQQPDPTIEADIDGKYGSGSTPAYRNRSLIVHNALSLSRWGGVVPNITAVWEHETLRTLDLIFASLCERVGVLTANSDYDFTDIAIESRGLLISGRPFQPKEVIGSPDLQLAYNYFVTEADGQIIGYTEGNEPSITIPDTEVGWLEGDADLPDVAPEVESLIASEISLPREVHVKSLDPDNDWEPNTASAIRQITDGSTVELLEIQICQLSDERRETAQRKLYRDYVAGTAHKFTLPWTYLYLHPGYKITITRAEGFTHVMRLSSIDGGIGVLNCEGVALEPETFNQPANGVFPPGYIPPQPIPAMTIITLLDTPLLRDGDEAENNGIGFYMCGTPRTGVDINWVGFGLYANRSGTWTLLGSSSLPGTIGTLVSATGLSSDTSVFDRSGHFIVDLYGTTALSSITEAEALENPTRNLAVVGDMVIQFVTASQVAGFDNRWDISVLLNGRRGTEDHVTDSFTGKRFVLIDGAVKFVPTELSGLNNLLNYRAVTNGQSLGDAATVSFAWTGMTLRPLAPGNLRGSRDADGNILIQWTRRSRLGSGMLPGSDVPLAEEDELYEVEILNGSNVVLRTIRVTVDGGDPALLTGSVNPQYISFNSLLSPTLTDGSSNAYTKQLLDRSGSWIEARLSTTGSDFASIGLIEPQYASRWGYQLPTGIYRSTLNFSPVGVPGIEVTEAAPGDTFVTVRYSSGSLGVNAVRIRIVILGSEVRYYWDYTGDGSVPFYISNIPAPLPLKGIVAVVNATAVASKVQNIFVGQLVTPSTVYPVAQQVNDFGATQGAIKVRIYQISALVGRGPFAEATL